MGARATPQSDYSLNINLTLVLGDASNAKRALN